MYTFSIYILKDNKQSPKIWQCCFKFLLIPHILNSCMPYLFCSRFVNKAMLFFFWFKFVAFRDFEVTYILTQTDFRRQFIHFSILCTCFLLCFISSEAVLYFKYTNNEYFSFCNLFQFSKRIILCNCIINSCLFFRFHL